MTSIEVKAEYAERFANNLDTAALTAAGVPTSEIDRFKQALNKVAVELRESKSPSDETVAVGGKEVPKWFARHGLDQRY